MSDDKDVHRREQEIIANARRQRLEEQMKENLKRRKQQARARRDGGSGMGETQEPEDETNGDA